MHSDVETLERIEIIRDLRLGAFDVLVGIKPEQITPSAAPLRIAKIAPIQRSCTI
jgi:hypothetical protein